MPRQLRTKLLSRSVSVKHGLRKIETGTCDWCVASRRCLICQNCVNMFRKILQSTQWNITYRSNFLAANPLCVNCRSQGWFTPAVDVDHILAWRNHPDLFWEPSNHQALCHACHSRKTASERLDKKQLFKPKVP